MTTWAGLDRAGIARRLLEHGAAADVADQWALHLTGRYGKDELANLVSTFETLQATHSRPVATSVRLADELSRGPGGAQAALGIAALAVELAPRIGTNVEGAVGEARRLAEVFGDTPTAARMVDRASRKLDKLPDEWTAADSYATRMAWEEKLHAQHGTDRTLDIMDLAQGFRYREDKISVSEFTHSMRQAEREIDQVDGTLAGAFHREIGMPYDEAVLWAETRISDTDDRTGLVQRATRLRHDIGFEPADAVRLAREYGRREDQPWVDNVIDLASRLRQQVGMPTQDAWRDAISLANRGDDQQALVDLTARLRDGAGLDPSRSLHWAQEVGMRQFAPDNVDALVTLARKAHEEFGLSPDLTIRRVLPAFVPSHGDVDKHLASARTAVESGLAKEDALIWLSNQDTRSRLRWLVDNARGHIRNLVARGNWGHDGLLMRRSGLTIDRAVARQHIGFARGSLRRARALIDAKTEYNLTLGEPRLRRMGEVDSLERLDGWLKAWEQTAQGTGETTLAGRANYLDDYLSRMSTDVEVNIDRRLNPQN